jgi:GNAT superfamily N-acetyltransferase
MIRLAIESDLLELLRMSERFFDKSGYADLTTFSKEDSTKTLMHLIDAGTLLTDGKSLMLGFLVFPLFVNMQTIVAQELFWWVDEEARKGGQGIKLLKSAEKLAKEKGATALMMLSIKELDGEKINKLYSALGYTEREQTYMRAL